MKKTPLVRGMIELFPWGRIEKDGTFVADLAKAQFDVLGATGFGYWSQAGGLNPHLVNPGIIDGGQLTSQTNILAQIAAACAPPAGYMHGYQLLSDQHLDDLSGWKLTPRLVPRLDFSATTKEPPQLASKVDIVDWSSWYEWRGLPKESPAALLMHYPMSVYQLLVHILKVADPKAGSRNDRIPLNVQYLGAEVELNFIPL